MSWEAVKTLLENITDYQHQESQGTQKTDRDKVLKIFYAKLGYKIKSQALSTFQRII